MGLVWRCLFALVFLFRGGKRLSVLVVSSWSLRFRVNGLNCYLFVVSRSPSTDDSYRTRTVTRRKVASLSVFFKIDSLVDHPVRGLFPAQYVLRRPTRGALATHSRYFEMPRSRTVQYSRSFVMSCVRLRNGLHKSVFAGEGLGAFKTSVNRFLLQG